LLRRLRARNGRRAAPHLAVLEARLVRLPRVARGVHRHREGVRRLDAPKQVRSRLTQRLAAKALHALEQLETAALRNRLVRRRVVERQLVERRDGAQLGCVTAVAAQGDQRVDCAVGQKQSCGGARVKARVGRECDARASPRAIT